MPDDLISRAAVLREIMGQPPEAHYPDWYAEIVKRVPAVAGPEVVFEINAEKLESERVEELIRSWVKKPAEIIKEALNDF